MKAVADAKYSHKEIRGLPTVRFLAVVGGQQHELMNLSRIIVAAIAVREGMQRKDIRNFHNKLDERADNAKGFAEHLKQAQKRV